MKKEQFFHITTINIENKKIICFACKSLYDAAVEGDIQFICNTIQKYKQYDACLFIMFDLSAVGLHIKYYGKTVINYLSLLHAINHDIKQLDLSKPMLTFTNGALYNKIIDFNILEEWFI